MTNKGKLQSRQFSRPLRGPSRIIVPVTYIAWVQGDLGASIERTLAKLLGEVPNVRVSRLPRAFFLEADEEPGVFLEAAHRALLELEDYLTGAYPAFHSRFGSLWTGTLQAVFDTTRPLQPLSLPEAAVQQAAAATA